MREVDFSKKTIRKQWKLVNEWYSAIEDEYLDPEQLIQQMVQKTIELSMDLERYRHLAEDRENGLANKANGYYYRNLDTTFGSIERLKVPRTRHSQRSQRWFSKYQRRWQKVDRLLLSCLIGGLSCRKAVKIMSKHYHWSLSPTLISNLAGQLRQALEEYRRCQLNDEYVGLIIDGAWFRFRQLYGPKRVVLAVLGVKADRTIVLLGFHVAKSESAREAVKLLADLKSRGLKGHNLQVVAADGGGGIKAALREVFPYVPYQRCCWHHLQILKNHASCIGHARAMMKEAAKCYRSGNLTRIQRQLNNFMKRWGDKEPRAIALFGADLELTLTYLQLPNHMHRWFRTTNYIERVFRDLRQRTKLIGSFAQPAHLENYLIGIISEVQWISLPVDLQPLLTKDTII
jgi:putative transposase